MDSQLEDCSLRSRKTYSIFRKEKPRRKRTVRVTVVLSNEYSSHCSKFDEKIDRIERKQDAKLTMIMIIL